jgi:hypothetical protein
MKVNINPFNTGNPMTMKDAAVVATIAAFVIWILQFFANAQYAAVVEDPGAWCFEAIKNYAVSWAGTFISLAGLEQLVKHAEQPAS